MATPSMEDYLEKIYKLTVKKGYARVTDVAEQLNVNPSSVTKMIQKLDYNAYLFYEKYRGFSLTEEGLKLGERLAKRHKLLEDFLRLIGVEEENIYKDVEGIEHYLSKNSVLCIEKLVKFFFENKDIKEQFQTALKFVKE